MRPRAERLARRSTPVLGCGTFRIEVQSMKTHVPAMLLACAGFVSGCGDAAEFVVRGSVGFRERMALPPDAIVSVRLSDVSRQDAAAPVVAETTISTAGRQPPIPFELRVPAKAVDPKQRVAIRATIQVGDRMLFT